MKWKTRKVRIPEALACVLWYLCPAAAAQTPESSGHLDAEAWEVQSVRELMQLDMERALDQARRGAHSPAGVSEAGGRSVPRLVAMYGVGRSLMAEVLVGSQAYLYVRGQAFPVGYTNDPAVYQLRGMNGSCIQLHSAQSNHSLCLHLMLGRTQP